MGRRDRSTWFPLNHDARTHPPPPPHPSLLGPNMTLLACIWVPWVSFPPLLTANFDFIDVSLFCWHQETSLEQTISFPPPLLSCLPHPFFFALISPSWISPP